MLPPMRVLAITNLFPNVREPNRGIFNLQQFEALQERAEVRVIAPVAWQPWAHGLYRPAPFDADWNGGGTYRSGCVPSRAAAITNPSPCWIQSSTVSPS